MSPGASASASASIIGTPTATCRVCDKRDLVDEWPRVRCHVEEMSAGDSDYTPSDLRDSLARGDTSLLLMEDGDTLLGFAVIHAMDFPRRRYIREAHLWVLPEHRGHGLFAAYLSFLRAWARDHGYDGTTVALAAHDEPRWRPLMLAHGFTPRTVEYMWETR